MNWIGRLALTMVIALLGGLIIINLASATLLNETQARDIVCSDINLTGTNCTTWWGNLSIPNASYINLNVSVSNNYTNYTYTNYTYTNYTNYTEYHYYYNVSGNLTEFFNNSLFNSLNNSLFNSFNNSFLNNTNYTYTRNQIDSKINGFILTTDVNNRLNSYALKTDVQNTTTTEIKDIEAGWKWAIGINIFITVLILIGLVILFQQ